MIPEFLALIIVFICGLIVGSILTFILFKDDKKNS